MTRKLRDQQLLNGTIHYRTCTYFLCKFVSGRQFPFRMIGGRVTWDEIQYISTYRIKGQRVQHWLSTTLVLFSPIMAVIEEPCNHKPKEIRVIVRPWGQVRWDDSRHWWKNVRPELSSTDGPIEIQLSNRTRNRTSIYSTGRREKHHWNNSWMHPNHLGSSVITYFRLRILGKSCYERNCHCQLDVPPSVLF